MNNVFNLDRYRDRKRRTDYEAALAESQRYVELLPSLPLGASLPKALAAGYQRGLANAIRQH